MQCKKIDVQQPKLFPNYNSSMGVVDLLDQSVNSYRVLMGKNGGKFHPYSQYCSG